MFEGREFAIFLWHTYQSTKSDKATFTHYRPGFVINQSVKVDFCIVDGLDTSGDSKTDYRHTDSEIISSVAQAKLDFVCGPVIDFRVCISGTTQLVNGTMVFRNNFATSVFGPVGVG